MARPTTYSPKVADAICDALAEGVSLSAFCQAAGSPSRATVYRWTRERPDFQERFLLAREIQAHAINDIVVEIATGESSDRSDPKLLAVRLDAAKWASTQLAPKHYGAKAHTTIAGDAAQPLQVVIKRYEPPARAKA